MAGYEPWCVFLAATRDRCTHIIPQEDMMHQARIEAMAPEDLFFLRGEAQDRLVVVSCCWASDVAKHQRMKPLTGNFIAVMLRGQPCRVASLPLSQT